MRRVTYVPEFRFVLTKRCAHACGYCNFPTTPSPTLPSLREIRRVLRMAWDFGASVIRFEAGEDIANLSEILSQTRYHGCLSWSDYLAKICCEVARQDGRYMLFPQLDVGRLPSDALRKLSATQPTLRMMFDGAEDRLQHTVAHENAPQKTIALRIAALQDAGRAKLPVETGIMVGLGESLQSVADIAVAVSQLHREFGHVQTFNVTPFVPQKFTPMNAWAPVSDEQILRTLTTVRQSLDFHILLSAELAERPALAVEAAKRGLLEDLGHVSFGQRDRTRFDMPLHVENLRSELAKAGYELAPRMPLSETYVVNGPLSALTKLAVDRYRVSQTRPATSVAI